MQNTSIDALKQESAVELLIRVDKCLPSLTGQQQSIALSLLRNQLVVGYLGIRELAAEWGVPPSTIVHFARRFGYSGFGPFRQVFKDALREIASRHKLLHSEVDRATWIEVEVTPLVTAVA